MKKWLAGGLAASVLLVVSSLAESQTTSLAGVIDFHVHSGPDSRPRSVSDRPWRARQALETTVLPRISW